MIRLALVAFLFLVAAGDAGAQGVRPGVDCSLLTARQAQGLPCVTPPKPEYNPDQPTGDPFVDDACIPAPGPDSPPDRAILCHLMMQRRLVEPAPYLLFGVYEDATDVRRRLVVTDLRLEPDGRTTVVGRWLRHPEPAQQGRPHTVAAAERFVRVDP